MPRRIGSGGKTRLAIGIPTAPRGEDYLAGTVESLLDALPLDSEALLRCEIRIVVMNMGGDEHTAFRRLAERFSQPADTTDELAQKAKDFLRMVDSPGIYEDPTPNALEPDHMHNPLDLPGRAARKQNCDVLNLLSHMQGERADYFMLMEDDFATCPGAVHKIAEAIRKLNATPLSSSWLALRVSYGMNGLVLHRSDAAAFAAYLLEHRTRKPVDLLWVEFVLPSALRPLNSTRGRELFTYRWNLFAHRGEVSSFPGRPHRKHWPGCSVEMDRVWSLQAHERFAHRCAAEWEFTPCSSVPSARPAAPLPRARRGPTIHRALNASMADGAAEQHQLGGRAAEVEGVSADEIEDRRRRFKERLQRMQMEAMGRGGAPPEPLSPGEGRSSQGSS